MEEAEPCYRFRNYKLWLFFVSGMSCAVLVMAAINWNSRRRSLISAQEGEDSGSIQGSLRLAGLTQQKEKAYLGVEVLEMTEGLFVDEVATDSPAEKGGIRRGDLIIRYDRRDVKDISRIQEIVARSSPGDRVKIDVDQEGKRKSFYVKLGSLSPAEGANATSESRR